MLSKRAALGLLERRAMFSRFGSADEKITELAIKKLEEIIADEILLGVLDD